MSIAYSYLRFSTPEQAKGDSIRRQVEKTADWCERNKVTLDTSLKPDLGVSAFKGRNRDVGALGEFLRVVEAGHVEKGSYLVVESLDRLTREGAQAALRLILNLTGNGVRIVQLTPVEMVYDDKSEAMTLMMMVMELNRGHSESKVKSERVAAAWAQKQKGAGSRIVTRSLPGWIAERDGKLLLDEDKAKTVRRVFALAIGGHGARAIARTLNADAVPVFGRETVKGRPVAWGVSAVFGILTSPAAVGIYVPYRKRAVTGEPVPNYFPSVVDEATFYAAQAGLKSRGAAGRGRKGKHVNLFAGLLTDARDGGTISYRHTKSRPAALIPVNSLHNAGGKWVSFPAGQFEDALLSRLVEVTAADVAGDTDADKAVSLLGGRLAELDGLIAKWAGKMDDPNLVDVVAAKLSTLGAERKQVVAELADARREAASPIGDVWQEVKTLAHTLVADNSDETRTKVRATLRRAVESVTCLFLPATGAKFTRLAAVRVQFRTGAHRDYLIVARTMNAAAKRPATWSALSAPWPESGPLDLRNPADASEIEKALTKLDVASRPA